MSKKSGGFFIVAGGLAFEAFEYFCYDCLQLRLCLNPDFDGSCGNCGSANIKKAACGEIDKEKEIAENA